MRNRLSPRGNRGLGIDTTSAIRLPKKGIAMPVPLRNTGIDRIKHLPWGTHFCHFYETKADLLDVLIPYFKMGLANHEFCLWVVYDPLSVEEATAALRKAIPTIDRHLATGDIELMTHVQWYLENGTFDLQRVIAAWRAKLKQALDSGYAGVRANGNEAWLTAQNWHEFALYEETLNELVAAQPMLVLCTYPLTTTSAADLFDVARTHDFTTTKRNGRWEILETSALTQSTLNSLSAHICVLNDSGLIIAVNNLWETFARANDAAIDSVGVGSNYLHVCESTQGEERPSALAFAAGIRAVIQGQRDYFELEYPCHSPQEKRWFTGRVTPLAGSATHFRRVVVAHENISAFKQLEGENEQLLAQFHQAQKLESIGRLAGGIAHDFNNMLVPIIGYAEAGMRKVATDSPLHRDLERIKGAGERAAALTRQILAFSRQQVLEMQILDLNQVIREFDPMLRRLIREDIAVQTHLAATLPSVKGDKGQLAQILLNLVVNAGDAMPDGGLLTITTDSLLLDERCAAKHPGVQPGPYLLLAVSDTGQGMDAATQARIFNPFFTTKPQGQGTGLGLATVFGIVKQHNGTIGVYSEIGYGTTFKLYLPAAYASLAPVESVESVAESVDGNETVLLVEDDANVRQLVADILQEHGYRVLEAETPARAIAVATAYEGAIDLLLTDVIMPGMNGRKLYELLSATWAGLKVLYMSGYTDDVIAHHQILEADAAFLQKPFAIPDLLQKLRLLLR